MSLRIIKAGLLDTVQDAGRKGHEHLGINPGGAMDVFSYQLGNALLGNDLQAPSLELHYPAAQFYFEKPSVICLTGADFTPFINGHPVPLHHPIFVAAGSLLLFKALKSGCRCYLSFKQTLALTPWLGSYSTHLKAGAGGFEGRALQKEDVLWFTSELPLKQLPSDTMVLHWTSFETTKHQTEILFLIGNEWSQLTTEAQAEFQNHWFQITNDADRMGYRLAGPALMRKTNREMLSSGVGFGTVQLLPDGQIIVLMADHQTTGGYPRIAQVISVHLPLLAQKRPNDVLHFIPADLKTAEQKMAQQQQYLADLQLSSAYRMNEFLHQA